MEENNFLPIGKIVGAHGVKGTLKVYSYAESFSIFKPGIRIHLKNTNGGEKTYTIRWAKPHKHILRLCLQGISTRDQARFGLLFLRRGNWEGKQLISEKWIDMLRVPSPANPSYGYMWWLNTEKRLPNVPESVYFAAGFGNTVIEALPRALSVIA